MTPTDASVHETSDGVVKRVHVVPELEAPDVLMYGVGFARLKFKYVEAFGAENDGTPVPLKKPGAFPVCIAIELDPSPVRLAPITISLESRFAPAADCEPRHVTKFSTENAEHALKPAAKFPWPDNVCPA